MPGSADSSAAPNRPDDVEVAICVPSYRRPHLLSGTLHGISTLEPTGARLRVIVVDNGPDLETKQIVEGWRPLLGWPLEYVEEPRPGISQARNAAVARAGGARFVAFVDDDETPSPGWLRHLLDAQRRSGADVVAGPVVRQFDHQPPLWFLQAGFFRRREFPSGLAMEWATTANALVSMELLERYRPPFDERYGESGGEDTHFFMRARLDGYRIVWCDEAEVTEYVPRERARMGWVLRREYRRGNTLSLCLVDFHSSPLRRIRRVLHASYRMIEGLGLVLRAPVGGRTTVAQGLHRIAFGLGMLTGLLGVRHEEYRR